MDHPIRTLSFRYLFLAGYVWRVAPVLVDDRSVAKVDVLSRVKRDLAQGHTHTATQRLRTLIAIHPDDLYLRRMLASVYRQTGNLAEAGRWAFLTEEITPTEMAAFERANPDPWLRLRMLRWSGEDSGMLPDTARARLQELEAAARSTGPPSAYQGPLDPAQRPSSFVRSSALPCLFVVVALGTLGLLAAVGFIRVLSWIIG